MLSSRAVAYLNVDVSVVGPVFRPSATPQLDELLQETIKLVSASYLKQVIATYQRKKWKIKMIAIEDGCFTCETSSCL